MGALAKRNTGAAMVEAIIALPILIVVILGAIQFGLIYQAKATLNHASLQGARAGAVENANPNAIRRGLARGLVPLYSPRSSLEGVIETVARINAELATDARVRILNPTREAFADFGEDVNGVREIPNDRLHARSTTLGTQSGVNIQDANILRVEVTYGYELKVPLVNWFIARALLTFRGADRFDAFQQQLLRRTRLPVIATATVRMQTPARISDSVIALADLPEVQRFAASSRPPDDVEDGEPSEDEEHDGGSNDGEDDGSNLGDGFLGYGGGSGAGGGGGEAPPPPSGGTGGAGGGGVGGGGNNGNPQQCSADEPDPSPFPPREQPPGDSSPLPPRDSDPLSGLLQDQTSARFANSASLPGIGLPSLGVGNPIHVATGNKYQAESDIAPAPGALSVEFARHYNSSSAARAGVMGMGWRHNYEAQLHLEVSGGQRTANGEEGEEPSIVYLTQADGRELKFIRRADHHERFLAQRASDGELIALPCDGDTEATKTRNCTRYVWQWVSGRELHFEGAGLLREIREGRSALRLEYNDAKQLTRVVDAQQRTLEVSYYPNGRVAQVDTDHAGAISFTYDARGNLEHAISSDGHVRRYHYEDTKHPHHLTGISVGVGRLRSYGESGAFERVASWGYDTQGRGVFSTHPGGLGKVTLSYGAGYTDVTDAFGRVSRYVLAWRDGVALVKEVRGPGCSACGRGDVVYSYNEDFQVIQVASKHLPTLHYDYDALQRLHAVHRDTGGRTQLLARYSYEGDQHAPSLIERLSVNPEGRRIVEIERRADGLPLAVEERGYTPLANGGFAPQVRRIEFSYDDADRLARIDGPRHDAADVTRFLYDARGRLEATITPGGNEQRVLARDAAGRPTRIQSSGGPEIELRYDAQGQITRIARKHRRGERGVSIAYDAAGRAQQIQHDDGRTERFTNETTRRFSTRTDERTGLTQAVLSAADGQIDKRAVLAGSGSVLQLLHFAYDAQRRLSEIRDGDGPALRRLIYVDDDAQPDRIIDALGRETAFEYDTLKRLSGLIAADGGRTRFERDALGRVTQLTAPNDASTRYEYDDFGRRVREHSSDRGMAHYTYDAANNLIERVDARGARLQFSYTPDGQLASARTREGVTTFDYLQGRLTRVTGPTGYESFEYDADGALIKHTRRINGHRFTTQFRYNAAGKLEQRQLASGEWLEYRYNDAGELSSIARDAPFRSRALVTAERANHGRLDPFGALRYGNGLTLRTQFDQAGRIASRHNGVTSLRYTLDDENRLIEIDGAHVHKRYLYDAVDRLIGAQHDDQLQLFSYDANGNREWETRRNIRELEGHRQVNFSSPVPSPAQRGREREGANRSYNYSPSSNRMTESMVAGADIQYDAAGNPVRFGARTYEYNSFGRPTRLFIGGRLASEYTYNAWGERISKTIHSGDQTATTFFLYEQHRLIAEANERGRITREYVYADHHPIAMIEDGVAHWIHTDHLGAPVAVTNNDRVTIWQAQYEPFGLAHVEEDPDRDGRKLTLNLRFPGQYADAESGTYYNIMRDYDPHSGRYLTPDPLGAFAGLNSYVYAQGNPAMRFDALGLYDEMVHYYMTYFLALVAGLPQDIARTMAIAAQYIDENPLTMPTTHFGPIPTGANEAALPLYHFVLDYDEHHYGDPTADPLRRFYNPSSDQLTALRDSTDAETLERLWLEAHPSEPSETCEPTRPEVNAARYQLYGEYLHAYEDTFTHRDSLNMSYAVESNDLNTPIADEGHFGLHGPSGWEAPDRTYNQDDRPGDSQCQIFDVRRGSVIEEGVTAEQCNALGQAPGALGSRFTPPPDEPSRCEVDHVLGGTEVFDGLSEQDCMAWTQRAVHVTYTQPNASYWRYNELRTLRMEHEIFAMLRQDFTEEIEANRERIGASLPLIEWRDLAGRDWNDNDAQANARLGLEQTYEEWRGSQGLSEVSTVLQQYNASRGGQRERLDILNDWLVRQGFVDEHNDPIQIELWRSVEGRGPRNRWDNIGWIPARSIDDVLLPRDEACTQQRGLSDCNDRPRR